MSASVKALPIICLVVISSPGFTFTVSRLLYTVSKLKTTDWLNKYQYLDIDVERIYRYLDKLYNHQKQEVQQISYDHTLKVLNGNIQIIFYDVTTVYFEAENED